MSLTPKPRRRMRKKDVKRCQSSKGWSSLGRISCWGCSLRGTGEGTMLSGHVTHFQSQQDQHPQGLSGKHTCKLMKDVCSFFPTCLKTWGRQELPSACCCISAQKVCSSVPLLSPLLSRVGGSQLCRLAHIPQQSH